MTDVLTIIIPIILSVIFIAVSFYLYAIFCHPQDTGIGITIFAKIIVIFGQTLTWLQLLIIILDLSIYTSSPQTIILLYDILYIVIYVLTVFILPFISAFYESDQDDSLCKRILSSFIYAIIISFVWSAFTFLSYIGLSIFTNEGYDQRVRLPLYMMLCQGLVGWILLVINATLGLLFVPYDLIMEFVHRPKTINKQQAYDIKQQLQDRSDQLIEQGQKLQIQQKQFKQKQQALNFFTRRKQLSILQKQIKRFKNSINQLQNDYQIFSKQIDFNSQNPIIPYLKLIIGILSIILSIVWIVQIFGATVYIDGKVFFSFLDQIFHQLAITNVGFVSVILYGIMVIYMQACLIKGNTIFGVRIPFIMQFHSLVINKTLFNSFLFNIILMLLTSISILHLSIIVFPVFLDSSYLGMFFNDQVSKLPLFGFLYNDRIYTIVFLSFFGVAIIYLIVKICRDKSKVNRRKSTQKVK